MSLSFNQFMGQVEGIKMKLETKDYKVKATYLFY